MAQDSLDAGSETGHSPGAESSSNEKPSDIGSGHLSSVVEQRFRKPADSRELPDTSSEKPVNAGDYWKRVDEDVKEALEWADRERARRSKLRGPGGVWHEDVLAAEVRRLQKQLDAVREERAAAGGTWPKMDALLAQPPAASPVDGEPHSQSLPAHSPDGQYRLAQQVSELQAQLRTALDAGEAAELRIVELRQENDRLIQQVSDLTDQLHSMIEQAQREANALDAAPTGK